MLRIWGRRRHWIIAIPLTLSVVPACRAQPSDTMARLPEAAAAIRFFEDRGLASLESLRKIRPPRRSPEFRRAVIRGLPTEGDLTPTVEEQCKLSSIDAVLACHDRTGAVEIKLMDVFQAAVSLHARCVILISRPALNLLTAAEVQALAAHEIGHDYFWDAYEQALASDRTSVMRELELRCDGIALLTLRELGVDPFVLATAIKKMYSFNGQFGTALNAGRYVPLADRLRFQRAFVLFAGAVPSAHADDNGQHRQAARSNQ